MRFSHLQPFIALTHGLFSPKNLRCSRTLRAYSIPYTQRVRGSDSPMRQLQPVIWSKGTFLSPQHLQAQERFVEDSARFYLDSLNSRAWGFSEIQIDTKALSEGRLAVTLASGIFPDA